MDPVEGELSLEFVLRCSFERRRDGIDAVRGRFLIMTGFAGSVHGSSSLIYLGVESCEWYPPTDLVASGVA